MAKPLNSKKASGPAPKFNLPQGMDGQPCQILFGHNTEIRKVLMQFGVAAERLIFSPEEARDVASKLNHYALMAEGKKVM